jgi:MFS superfamily sulfate permease-like transporter
MELLLNLIWLLLMVPAYQLWRSTRHHPEVYPSSFVVLVLACALAILFPVISASDDIQAMRPEMEDGRDGVRSPDPSRGSSFAPSASSSVPILAGLLMPGAENQHSGTVLSLFCPLPAVIILEIPFGRAPPLASVW